MDNISPIDGRYQKVTHVLSQYFQNLVFLNIDCMLNYNILLH